MFKKQKKAKNVTFLPRPNHVFFLYFTCVCPIYEYKRQAMLFFLFNYYYDTLPTP